MSIQWRNRITVIVFLAAFFVLGSIANVTWNEPLSFTGTMVFSSLFIMWSVSVRSRVIHVRERRYFTLLGGFMLLWMVERAVKYSFFLQNEWLERHLWYGYYIPILLMPLISLMLAMSIGKTDAEKLNPKLKWLYLPDILLIAGFLTNDRHQLAFRFAPSFENWGDDYSYGILYYIALAWIIALVLATLIRIVRFSSANASKKRGMIPLAVIIVSLIGVGIYNFTDFRHTRILNVTELFCFCVAAFWEACLQTGLIPANTGYDLLFKHSHLAAKITDNAGKVVYEAAARQQEGACYIEHRNLISGGEVVWLEDVTFIKQQKAQLEQANSRLSRRAELQEKENALKEEHTRLAEQRRIYDRLNASLAAQTQHINRLVSEAEENEQIRQSNMLWVCVIGAYIKRKTNLMLLAEKQESIALSELYLAYKESLAYLSKAGVACKIGAMPEAVVPAGLLLYAYDELETLLERKMPSIQAVNIQISEKAGGIMFDIKVDNTPLSFAIDKGVRV
ncbi:MAG: hypothetical protein E7517_08940 [Ruminococcaceae bacterium]|nr:hypothetical protein [Oscillospiraceae bacterium]